ncbi:MAG: hypothetical protein M3270_09770 [Thermoproteota archaeon]|nr:hypothetical protein [Thermoproteota archaeon]
MFQKPLKAIRLLLKHDKIHYLEDSDAPSRVSAFMRHLGKQSSLRGAFTIRSEGEIRS